MSEAKTVEKSCVLYHEDEDGLKKSQNEINVVSIKIGKLLKLRHKIQTLKTEALNGYCQELKELKSVCDNTNALLGELNDGTRRNKTG